MTICFIGLDILSFWLFKTAIKIFKSSIDQRILSKRVALFILRYSESYNVKKTFRKYIYGLLTYLTTKNYNLVAFSQKIKLKEKAKGQ